MQIINTERAVPPASAAESRKPKGREYLVFGLGGEEYALAIEQVQELRNYETATRLANAPDFIKGVINLRGIIVPIVDMRIKFGVGTSIYDASTVVIILNVGARVIGIVVDKVSDVVTLTPEQIKPAPGMNALIDADYLIGLGTIDDRMLILTDVDKLMSGPELGLINALAA